MPVGHCRQRLGWASGGGQASAQQLYLSCCLPCLWRLFQGWAPWRPSFSCKHYFSSFWFSPKDLRPGSGRPQRAPDPGQGWPCLQLCAQRHSGRLSLGRPGLEGRSSVFELSSGGLAWSFCRGVRCWRVSRCQGRHSSPAPAPGPGSCPSAALAVGCSPWAAAGAPAPGGASPSSACGEVCRTHGPQRSQRDGRMTLSCPHRCLSRQLTTPGGYRPFPGGPAPRCSQTRSSGELPTGRLAAGKAWATSGQP